MMSTKSPQRTALITGATSGLGRAMAQSLAASGVAVALHYRHNQTAVNELAAQLAAAGHQGYPLQGDLSTPSGACAVAGHAIAILGQVDILINNAGDWVDKPLLQTSDEEWARLIDVDLRAPYLLIRALAPAMREQGWGRILNISSIASLGYVPGEGLYGVAKAGINMLTKAFAVELAPHGVTVNAVAPAWTLPADQPFPTPAGYPQCHEVPNLRPGHAREVAALVRFLVSADAAHITGQVLPIDGGLSATLPKGR
jgi:NAD(P)-dependent dehydrogenase (short-subunit alcohol dehydrogenase family)